MDQVVHILWESAQKKVFTRKNIAAKIAAVELPWILTNQGSFSTKTLQGSNSRDENHEKCLEVCKLDYVITLEIIIVRFAIGMIFVQFQVLLSKIGIFLRKESVEVTDPQTKWTVILGTILNGLRIPEKFIPSIECFI